jgi:hypothetical protein
MLFHSSTGVPVVDAQEDFGGRGAFTSDGYYVEDGRHRVSVARAIGQRDIDAWVR